MANEIATRTNDLGAIIAKREEKFSSILPPGIPFERFRSVMMTAVANSPDLILKCSFESLILAAMKAAEDGLLPDGREAAFIPFAGTVQYVQMVAGLRKLAWGSSLQAVVQTHLVYEGETIRILKGSESKIIHEVTLDSLDQGMDAVIGAYAIATLPDGRQLFEVMGKAEIKKFREFSKAKRAGSPWIVWPEQMLRSRPAKRLLKALPLQSNSDADRRLSLAANRYEEAIESTAEEMPDAIAHAQTPALSHEAHLESVLGVRQVEPLPVEAVRHVRPDAAPEPEPANVLYQMRAEPEADPAPAPLAPAEVAPEAAPEPAAAAEPAPAKRRGRPAGSPNKAKGTPIEQAPVEPPAIEAAEQASPLDVAPSVEPVTAAPPPIEQASPVAVTVATDATQPGQELFDRIMEIIGEVSSAQTANAVEAELRGDFRKLSDLNSDLTQEALRALRVKMVEYHTPDALPAAPPPSPEPDPIPEPDAIQPDAPDFISQSDGELFVAKIRTFLKPHERFAPHEVVGKLRESPVNRARMESLRFHHPHIFAEVDDALANHEMGL